MRRSLAEQWQRLGAASGITGAVAYTVMSAAPLTPAQGAVVACVFGAAWTCASLGVHQVLHLRARKVTADLGLLANLAAGFDGDADAAGPTRPQAMVRDGIRDGATDSSDRTLRAAFEAANGLQLGLDVAWDVFIGVGTVLLAVNMWNHPRFGRAVASAGVAIAVPFLMLVGFWYLLVSVCLARAGRWVAATQRPRPADASSSAADGADRQSSEGRRRDDQARA